MTLDTSFPPPQGGGPPPMPAADDPTETPAADAGIAVDYWQTFGFVNVAFDDGAIHAQLPADTVLIRPVNAEGHTSVTSTLGAIGVKPELILRHGPFPASVYRIADADFPNTLEARMPEHVIVAGPGGYITLPSGAAFNPQDYRVGHISDLSILAVTVVEPGPEPAGETTTNPLLPFSLRGSAAAFEERAKDAKPLLGEICLSGQATVWYAPPNAGKTLLALNLTIQAVREGRISAGNVFYVNADDNSSGLASKLRILDDLGAHTLVPGFRGFKAVDLATLLRTAATSHEAMGVLVIIDTVKKFASLMDKRESSTFADACRQFVMHGGSVLALAHTTKNPNADGKLRYAGTTDLIEDLDAAYVLTPVDADGEAGERIVQFSMLKRRADNPETAAYAYAGEVGITYDERLASVRPVELDQLDTFKRVAEQKSDAEIIVAIAACISDGINKKMDLAKAASERAGIAERAAIRMIEKYTGDDPEHHRWRFSVKERGAKLFELLPAPPP